METGRGREMTEVNKIMHRAYKVGKRDPLLLIRAEPEDYRTKVMGGRLRMDERKFFFSE